MSCRWYWRWINKASSKEASFLLSVVVVDVGLDSTQVAASSVHKDWVDFLACPSSVKEAAVEQYNGVNLVFVVGILGVVA